MPKVNDEELNGAAAALLGLHTRESRPASSPPPTAASPPKARSVCPPNADPNTTYGSRPPGQKSAAAVSSSPAFSPQLQPQPRATAAGAALIAEQLFPPVNPCPFYPKPDVVPATGPPLYSNRAQQQNAEYSRSRTSRIEARKNFPAKPYARAAAATGGGWAAQRAAATAPPRRMEWTTPFEPRLVAEDPPAIANVRRVFAGWPHDHQRQDQRPEIRRSQRSPPPSVLAGPRARHHFECPQKVPGGSVGGQRPPTHHYPVRDPYYHHYASAAASAAAAAAWDPATYPPGYDEYDLQHSYRYQGPELEYYRQFLEQQQPQQLQPQGLVHEGLSAANTFPANTSPAAAPSMQIKKGQQPQEHPRDNPQQQQQQRLQQQQRPSIDHLWSLIPGLEREGSFRPGDSRNRERGKPFRSSSSLSRSQHQGNNDYSRRVAPDVHSPLSHLARRRRARALARLRARRRALAEAAQAAGRPALVKRVSSETANEGDSGSDGGGGGIATTVSGGVSRGVSGGISRAVSGGSLASDDADSGDEEIAAVTVAAAADGNAAGGSEPKGGTGGSIETAAAAKAAATSAAAATPSAPASASSTKRLVGRAYPGPQSGPNGNTGGGTGGSSGSNSSSNNVGDLFELMRNVTMNLGGGGNGSAAADTAADGEENLARELGKPVKYRYRQEAARSRKRARGRFVSEKAPAFVSITELMALRRAERERQANAEAAPVPVGAG